MSLRERYGQWAVVAGASEGLGAAFAAQLAASGMDLLLLARREEPLRALAEELAGRHGVKVEVVPLDLGAADLPARMGEVLGEREVGVLVCNAAFAPKGALSTQTLSASLTAVDVNCRSTLVLIHAVLPGMTARRRGGIVVMSSLTAFQGSPYVAVYGATKAFGLALAEGLWAELGPLGIDVLACCAGATRTPGYLRSVPDGAPGELDPEVVAIQALKKLGRAPFMVPGLFNRIASFFMRKVLPRRTAVAIMAAQTAKLQAPRST